MSDSTMARAFRCLAAAAAFVFAAVPALAAQDEARAFFKDKTMRFITMGGPGGGFDTYMRTIAPYLEKSLEVKVLPVNESGAGGLRAMNRLLMEPADGLTILLTFGEAMIGGQIYGVSGARYDVNELVWLGRVASTPKVVLVGPKTPFQTFAEALEMKKPIIWGGTGKTDGNSDFAAIISHALGLDAKMIGGYKGSRNMLMAVEQGELDAQVLTDESGARAAQRGKIKAIVTLDRQRSKRFPDVPTVFEAAKPTPEQAWWLDWRANVTATGRILVTAPGVPADRVALLRAAVKDVLHDPEFLADAKKRKRSINYMGGEEVDKLIKDTMASIDKSRLPEIRQVVLEKFYDH